MSINTQEFNDRVARWQQSEPGELAQNFHALQTQPTVLDGPPSYQFVKATSFPIADLQSLRDVAATVTEIRIWMTLKQFDKYSVGFDPILEVYYLDKTGVSKSLLLDGAEGDNMILGDTEPVPLPFVQNTTQLWKELESENLPGMFDVRTATGRIERAQFYKVEGVGLEIMKALLPTAINMNILPGLDLNKSANGDDTIFIPIIQLKVPTIKIITEANIHNGHLTGVHWQLNDDDDDAFFDYSNPCPPFCDPTLSLS